MFWDAVFFLGSLFLLVVIVLFRKFSHVDTGINTKVVDATYWGGYAGCRTHSIEKMRLPEERSARLLPPGRPYDPIVRD
jgi:hypothetical protein